MAEKSAKRLKMEASLAEDPADSFLRYGLAMLCLREGDLGTGRGLLEEILAADPGDVPTLQQLGQSYMEAGDHGAARGYFERGIAAARARSDAKAAGEMAGFLDLLD